MFLERLPFPLHALNQLLLVQWGIAGRTVLCPVSDTLPPLCPWKCWFQHYKEVSLAIVTTTTFWQVRWPCLPWLPWSSQFTDLWHSGHIFLIELLDFNIVLKFPTHGVSLGTLISLCAGMPQAFWCEMLTRQSNTSHQIQSPYMLHVLTTKVNYQHRSEFRPHFYGYFCNYI